MTRTRLDRPIPALVLGCTLGLLTAAPAAGAPCASERTTSPLTAAWEALACFWNGFVGQSGETSGPHGPVPFAAADESEGGPHMDPDGLTAPPNPGTGGPHMDPNGLTARRGGNNGGPEMDPNGADPPPAEGDGGPEMDPDG